MKVNLYVTNFPNAGWNITHFKCRLSVYQQHYAKNTKLNLMKLGEVQREQSRESQNMVRVQIKERV